MTPIQVFIGYDAREPVAFHVAAHSIHRHASSVVSITPLILNQLGSIFQRERDPNQSTDFSFTRFLVPYLCQYQGWALFIDCDVMCVRDLAELWALRDDRFAVQVVKHDHQPIESRKFLNEPQHVYPCKNWSSVMLFNNQRCQALTPEFVNKASGLELHQFRWLDSLNQVGEIPAIWNHLVDYHPTVPLDELAMIHFTTGGPWFQNYRDCSYADAWRAELDRTIKPQ